MSKPTFAGAREGVKFLQEHGLALASAQRVVNHFGSETEEVVRSDPYRALRESSVVSFRCRLCDPCSMSCAALAS